MRLDINTGAVSLAILALSACGDIQSPQLSFSQPEIDILRDCATVTSQCPGVASISSKIPDLCAQTETDIVCMVTTLSTNPGTSGRDPARSYNETLAAMDTQAGICALSAVYSDTTHFGHGEFAILGIWTTLNGVQQYRTARYLPDTAAIEAINTPRAFRTACRNLVN